MKNVARVKTTCPCMRKGQSSYIFRTCNDNISTSDNAWNILDIAERLVSEVEIIDADEAPSFPHGLPEHVSPHENDENLVIECQVRGEPIPKIVWYVCDVFDIKNTWKMKKRVFELVSHRQERPIHVKEKSESRSDEKTFTTNGNVVRTEQILPTWKHVVR